MKKEGSHTDCFPLLVDDIGKEDIRKIRRTVMNTRGEILYANAVILAEGETEEQALGVFLREYFKKEPFELGINIIGVGGNNYTPFIRILDRLDIKWYIFSDGEQKPLEDLKNCLKNLLGEQTVIDLTNFLNIFYIDNGQCFETYCIAQGYLKEIIRAVCSIEENENYIKEYIVDYNHQKGKGGIIRNYVNDGDGGILRATKDCVLSGKTKYATAIAEEICKAKAKQKRIPRKVFDLFKKIETDMKVGE